MVHVPDFDNGPPEWVEDHVRRYRETNGADGHIWNNVTTLLLTTKGRNTGKDRTTPLIYQPYENNYVVIASKGGDDDHPDWYLNLKEHPEVDVQVGPERFKARARDATEEEREPMWQKMCKVWPDYQEYALITDRPIPVVVLEPQK